MPSKPKPRAAPGLYRIDTFSLVTHWGLKKGGYRMSSGFQATPIVPKFVFKPTAHTGYDAVTRKRKDL